MNKLPMIPLLLVTATGLALSGCNKNTSQNTPAPASSLQLIQSADAATAESGTSANDNGGSAKSIGSKVGQTLDDAALTTRVKSALAADTGLKTLILHVESDSSSGIVTVSGTVKSEQISDNVMHAIQAVRGVKAVNNQLVVKAS